VSSTRPADERPPPAEENKAPDATGPPQLLAGLACRRLKKVAGDSKRKVADVAREIVAAEEVFQQIDRV
jgi:hypothetical protein